MCGRYTLTQTNPDQFVATFSLEDPPPSDLPPRYNIAPTQPIPTIVRNPDTGRNEFKIMRWGLIPSWSKDASVGSKMINARCETLVEKPSFRTALNKRRCLVVADGFYEWKTQAGGSKQPVYITLKDHPLFGFAGLWERWTEPESGETVTTCTIITGEPNELIAPIHTRMALILPPDSYDRWLDPSNTEGRSLTDLFRPYPADQMVVYPVSRRVNAVTNDDPSLIERAS
jgi:putative SOS response-associated peptidase YedK